MASHLNLPYTAPASHQIETAWHLLTVLIRLGRPAPPTELAAVCAAFSPAPTPELVELLCRIPGSPLLLAAGGLVRASEPALSAIFGFLSGTIAPFAPKVPIGYWGLGRVSKNALVVYARKRRATASEGELALKEPRSKRRLILPSERDNDSNGDLLSVVNRLHSMPEERGFRFAYRVKEGSSSSAAVGIVSSLSFTRRTCCSPIRNSDAALVSCGVKETENTHGAVLLAAFQNPESNNGIYFGAKADCYTAMATSPEKIKIFESVPQSDCQHSIVRQFTKNKEEAQISTGIEDNELPTQMPIQNEISLIDSYILGSQNEDEFNVPIQNEISLIDSYILGSQNEDEFNVRDKEIRQNYISCDNSGCILPICSRAEPPDEMRNIQNTNEENGPSSSIPLSICKQQRQSIVKAKALKGSGLPVGNKSSCTLLHPKKDCFLEKHQDNQDCEDFKTHATGQKIVDTVSSKLINDTMADTLPKVTKIQIEPKSLPKFEPFIIEEEEGSGGYGTVYKARRKADGKILAIKCPHAKAHSHHINNEMKMLERFGGKNFVIKYEGSFKSDDLDCFVLEHVEHDRPEVLKKEINIFELRWYGYCMFRALASLHKQGVVHRDVKPGNFLYSRKLKKGYLIDFNLANDLQQKFLKNSKMEKDSRMKCLPSVKLLSSNEAMKTVDSSTIGPGGREATKDLKKHHVSKNTKKSRSPLKSLQKFESSNRCGSQAAADVSGITSTRDPTSTRTPPADRLKQPIPYKGRKELINFLHEAMQSPDKETPSVPASQRKRIAAPLGKIDSRLLILTPMPLRAGSNAVAGAGMFKNKGNGKVKREGPCVGTKGFRAPEVLFKSFHQGCKLDIWSAGVTLLYLIIGKTPFGGDPEQNIKEIAKLRGSEDLWEVAKLHDCESSYPLELFDVRSLRSTDLRDWCALNTRRPDFLDAIPESLFDLVDKCLSVNPRLRISAEDALMHEFFAPCHESLRKQRMLRRTSSSKSSS